MALQLKVGRKKKPNKMDRFLIGEVIPRVQKLLAI
jgi:hypothetical protein